MGSYRYSLAAATFLQEDTQLVSKSMDCLRILTTSNEANKEAIFQIPSSLSTLMKHMSRESDLVGLPIFKTSPCVSFIWPETSLKLR